MIRPGAPKQMWDHTIEFKGLICSHNANEIFAMVEEVPEPIMKGGTADISQICKFSWYNWLMFCNTANSIAFPDDKMTLGQYLGPAIDVGFALTAKILKQNRQYTCQLTLQHLTPEETVCAVHITYRVNTLTK